MLSDLVSQYLNTSYMDSLVLAEDPPALGGGGIYPIKYSQNLTYFI